MHEDCTRYCNLSIDTRQGKLQCVYEGTVIMLPQRRDVVMSELTMFDFEILWNILVRNVFVILDIVCLKLLLRGNKCESMCVYVNYPFTFKRL